MDLRAVICGILAAVALIGAVVLSALNADGYVELIGLAGTLSGYVVGLYSSPQNRGD